MNILDKFTTAYNLIRATIDSWGDDYASRMAAALAYRGIFSLIPILFIAIIIVGLVFGEQAAQNEVAEFLEGSFGPEAAAMIEAGIASTSLPTSSDRWLISLITLGVLIYAASGLFNEFKLALNTIWKVPRSASQGTLNWIKNRFIAVVMVLGVGFFFLSLMIINTTMSYIDAYIPLDTVVKIIGLAASFGATTLIIALVYRYVPDVELSWGDVWIGAIITALLLIVGIWAIGIYLAYSNAGSVYGAAGALLIILLWFYYAATIFLFGAKFTHTFTSKFGSKVVPVIENEGDTR